MRHKARQPVKALDSVSFEVPRGTAFGVIGSNGAGKSTLLRVLAGTLPPVGGAAHLRGRTSTLLQLGVGFIPELSGRRNVYLGGLANGLSRRDVEDRFNDNVAYAEMEHANDRPHKTYTSGMFSRLAFAVGMFMDPEILLLDEVLAVGDESFRKKSTESMSDLLDRAGTIVFVSHALNSLVEFCDSAMWLEHGKVRAIGPAAEVVGMYRDEVEGTYRTTAPTQGGPWTANQKAEAVLRIVAGAPMETVAAEYGISVDRLRMWRSAFIGAGRERLRSGAGDFPD
jgi:ABC-type polysaccharide/polyol phosphate transport system ATPase subunit